MSHVFIREGEVKQIITELYKLNVVAGLLCELCFLRNFRTSDVRLAKVSYFKKDNGQPKVLLKGDKTNTNEWYPIPWGIYQKIQDHVRINGLEPGDHVFQIVKRVPGVYYGHKGPITYRYLNMLWYRCCKKVGVYSKDLVTVKNCKECKHYLGNKQCDIMGKDKIRHRHYVHLKRCIEYGKVMDQYHAHPRLHESLRGVGAQVKVKFYMDQGLDYETACLKVFHQSNWSSFKIFKDYMSKAYEKKIGDDMFVKDFGDKVLVG